MAEKNTLVVIKSRPFTDLNYYEALRTAAGLWEHEVSVLWMGDGVYAALDDSDKSITGRFLEDLPDLDVELYVEEETLMENGFTEENLIEGVQLANREVIKGLFESAEASLVF
jgi:sulfur relay (sulfurtransferase) DsrF/TusC family protein